MSLPMNERLILYRGIRQARSHRFRSEGRSWCASIGPTLVLPNASSARVDYFQARTSVRFVAGVHSEAAGPVSAETCRPAASPECQRWSRLRSKADACLGWSSGIDGTLRPTALTQAALFGDPLAAPPIPGPDPFMSRPAVVRRYRQLERRGLRMAPVPTRPLPSYAQMHGPRPVFGRPPGDPAVNLCPSTTGQHGLGPRLGTRSRGANIWSIAGIFGGARVVLRPPPVTPR